MSETTGSESTENTVNPDPGGVFDDGAAVSDGDFETTIQEAAEARDSEEGTTETAPETPVAPAAETETPATPAPQAAGALQPEAPAETVAVEAPPAEIAGAPQVPLAALTDERMKRQRLEGVVETLQAQVNAGLQPPKPEAAPVDPETQITSLMDDGLSRVEAEQRVEITALKADAEEGRKFRAEQVKQAEHAEVRAAIQSQYQTAADAFAGTTPDFQEAYQHAINSRAEDLKLVYSKQIESGEVTLAQIDQQVTLDDLQLAAIAIQNGGNPAEMIYNYSKKVYGYRPGGGSGATAGGTDKAMTPNEKKLANVAKGQDAAISASNGSGSATEELTFDSLKGMKGKDFQEGWNKLVQTNEDILD